MFASNENCDTAMLNAPEGMTGRPLFQFDTMSAKIIKLYYTEGDLLAAKLQIYEPTTSLPDSENPIGGDVLYLADGAVEQGVDFRCRLVLSSDPPSGRPFINALKDVCIRLTDTVPNRPDVLTALQASIDADGLLLQMLSRRGVATAQDILEGSLLPVIRVLESLQAEDKSELTEHWWKSFNHACQRLI